jgi:hypothetical protein
MVGVTTGCLLFASMLLHAQTTGTHADSSSSYKFTAGYYSFSTQSPGWDVNLRRSSELGNVWLGYFGQSDAMLSQWRAGWDHGFGTDIRITPSVQMASGGFWGGSIQAEIGDPWFFAIGLGRTNLRPYFNLNFDPNDSYMLSVGKHISGKEIVALQYIRDNRENPDQRHTHFVYKRQIQNHERLGIDLLYKEGLVGGTVVHKWGLSLAYDWPAWFVRLTWDPNVNFSNQNSLRFSTGIRF